METTPLFTLDPGYSTDAVAAMTGLSFRQLDYYVRLRLLSPSRPARGSGTHRVWSAGDLARARFVAALRQLGASLDVTRRALEQLPDDPEEWPAWLFVSPDGELRQLHPRGPAWWGISVTRLLNPDRETVTPAA